MARSVLGIVREGEREGVLQIRLHKEATTTPGIGAGRSGKAGASVAYGRALRHFRANSLKVAQACSPVQDYSHTPHRHIQTTPTPVWPVALRKVLFPGFIGRFVGGSYGEFSNPEVSRARAGPLPAPSWYGKSARLTGQSAPAPTQSAFPAAKAEDEPRGHVTVQADECSFRVFNG